MKKNTRLKFPTLKNVDYLDLIKNQKTVLTLKGSDLENISWRDLQLLIGKQLDPDRYHYVLKFKSSNEIHRGTIKAIGEKLSTEKEIKNPDLLVISQRLNNLDDQIKKATEGNGVSIDLLLSVTKSSYETQITFIKSQLQEKGLLIQELKKDLSDRDLELNEQDQIIAELKEKTGIAQYLSIAKEFLQMKSKGTPPLQDLSRSDQADIPGSLLQVLGVIDWNSVEPVIIQEIENYLKIFCQKLPLKGDPNNG